MIKADTKKWARLVFNPYEELLLRKNFSNFNLTNKIPSIDQGKGLIITPNHISWWDGFFIDYVSRKFFNRKFHILMLEEQLHKYSFFRKTGAFSINPGSVKSIKESLDYAGEIIKDPRNVLVYYPQGKIESIHNEPDIKQGLSMLLRDNKDANILPAAFRIEYQEKKRPSIYFRSGNIISSSELLSDFNLFKTEFTKNIFQLGCDVLNSSITADLFSGKSAL